MNLINEIGSFLDKHGVCTGYIENKQHQEISFLKNHAWPPPEYSVPVTKFANRTWGKVNEKEGKIVYF